MGFAFSKSRLLGLFAALALALSIAHFPLLQTLDLKVLDLEFALWAKWKPTVEKSVVLIGVDEASESAFEEPLALWHRHFASAFKALAQGGARGVGLDYNLPQRSFDGIQPGLDGEMMRGLLALKKAQIPLVIGIAVHGDERSRIVRGIHKPFLTLNGEEGNALVMTPVDADGFLRRYREWPDEQGRMHPTLSGLLARRLGLESKPGVVDFSYGGPVHYVPFHDVVKLEREGRIETLKKHFENKIVFIGSVMTFEDRHYMPVNWAAWEDNRRYVPGVMFHVQAMRTFLGPGTLQGVPPLIQMGLIALLAFGCFGFSGPRWSWLVVLLLLPTIVLTSFWLMKIRLVFPVLGPMVAVLVGYGLRQGVEAALKLQERRRLRGVFAGYVSPAILKDILNGKIQPGLQGQRMPICVMFTDIRDFTTLSESMDPEALIGILNRYFHRMAEAIHQHGGTLDKFIGDGIMAFFGAPEAVENPCEKAFESARDMLRFLDELNAEWAREGGPHLRIGIGLHYGVAAVGHVGSEERHEYTAIGDTVNVASRVEGATKKTGYALLCTEGVLKRLDVASEFICVGEQPLKGHTPMGVYGWSKAPLSEEKK